MSIFRILLCKARFSVSFFGLLSCYGDERGMIEDMREIWSVFYGRVRFCFTGLNSSVSHIY